MLRTILTVLTLTLATPALAHHDGHHGAMAVTEGFARATLPSAPVGGAYVTVKNDTGHDDRLISASSPQAGEVQIHDSIMEGDVMKMVHLADGIAIPAGDSISLAPNGKHLMLMNLTGPLVEGETVEVTLTFEHAEPLTVNLPVAAIAATGAADHHHSH